MTGHVEVNDATAIMGQYQENVEDLESDGGHGEEIDRNQLRDVVLEESAPV
ncbi:MAG: hypothetical protein P4M04_16710 [Acidobacteriota bacterium]|nr:hypothetical protein [Acidobacteriota bacterium]